MQRALELPEQVAVPDLCLSLLGPAGIVVTVRAVLSWYSLPRDIHYTSLACLLHPTSVAARVCLCKMSNCDAHTKHDVVGAAAVTLITGHFPARCCGSRHISSDCGYPALETAKLACNSQLQLAKMGAYIQ